MPNSCNWPRILLRAAVGEVWRASTKACGQIPDVGVRAARATCQVHFADQEAALLLHQRAFGREFLRFFAQPGATPEFTRRLRGMIEQPVVDHLCFPGEPP